MAERMTTGMGMNESTGQQGGFDWGSVLSSGLGAAGALYSGQQGKGAINNALGSQTAAAGQANQALAPYAQVGQNAIGSLNKMMSGNYNLSELPGYTAGLKEGETAINRGLVARGNFGAGGSIPALTKFNQDYAQRNYGNEFNRLSSLLNVGQNAAGAQAGIYQGLGNAQGAAAINEANLGANRNTAMLGSLASLLGANAGGGKTVGGQLVSGLGSVAGGIGSLIGSGASAAGNYISDWYNNNFSEPGSGYNSDGSLYGSPYTGTGTTLQDLISGGGYTGSGGSDYWSDYTPTQGDYFADWSQYGSGDETYR